MKQPKSVQTFTSADKTAMKIHLAELDKFERTGLPLMNKALQEYAGVKVTEDGRVLPIAGFDQFKTTGSGKAIAERQSSDRQFKNARLSDVATVVSDRANFDQNLTSKEAAKSQQDAFTAAGNLAALNTGQGAQAVSSLSQESARISDAQASAIRRAQDRRDTLGSAAALGTAYGIDSLIKKQEATPKPTGEAKLFQE